MNLIKKLCQEKAIDLVKLFADHDKAAKGFIIIFYLFYLATSLIPLSFCEYPVG